MKNFCKKLIAVALLIMALTALAACGGGTDDTTSSGNDAAYDGFIRALV